MTSENRFNTKYKRVAVVFLDFKMPLYIRFGRVSVSPLAFFFLFFFCFAVRQHQPHRQYQKRRKDKKTGNGERVQQKEREIWPSENYDFAFYCCRAYCIGYCGCGGGIVGGGTAATFIVRRIHAVCLTSIRANSLRIVIFLFFPHKPSTRTHSVWKASFLSTLNGSYLTRWGYLERYSLKEDKKNIEKKCITKTWKVRRKLSSLDSIRIQWLGRTS